MLRLLLALVVAAVASAPIFRLAEKGRGDGHGVTLGRGITCTAISIFFQLEHADRCRFRRTEVQNHGWA
ncbi:hypothetical protein NL676_026475 [Syzygium grande]|nr:hypothetical protein NL676_026475 [Syzygium grande]